MPSLIALLQIIKRVRPLKYRDFRWSGKFDGVPCKVTSYHLVWEPQALDTVTVTIGIQVSPDEEMTVEAVFNPASGEDEALIVNGEPMDDIQISTDLDMYFTKFAIEGWFRWEKDGAPHEVYARGEHRYL